MIKLLIREYNRADRAIKALSYFLIAFLILIAIRSAILICEHQYSKLWDLLPQAVPLLSVLTVVQVANRLISNSYIIQENTRRQEIVQTTHHLIAISQDLEVRVAYVKTLLTEGSRPPISFIKIAKSLESRYETLLARDAYKYIPGTCIDTIARMSGSIFGITTLAENIQQTSSEKCTPLPKLNPSVFENLESDLEKLIQQLFELRNSIETHE